MALVSVSLLGADFACLGQGLEAMKQVGAKMVHLDVCDGHFAPGVTMGLPVIASLRKATDLLLDVHLQVERPERFVPDFIEAGADRLAVHPESTPDFCRVLRQIRQKGIQAGAALKHATSLEAVREVLDELDFVNILLETGEQPNSGRSLHKVNEVVRLRRERGARFAIEVEEAGIRPQRAAELAAAGVDVIVAGGEARRGAGLKGTVEELIRSASDTGEW